MSTNKPTLIATEPRSYRSGIAFAPTVESVSAYDFAVVSAGGLARKLASGLAGILLARRLGPSSFGLLSVAMALGVVLVPLGDLGMRTIGWLEAAQNGQRGVATGLLVIRLFLGLSVSLMTLLFAMLLPPDPHMRVALAICGFLPLFDSESVDWFFRAAGQHLLVALSDLLTALVQLTAIVMLVHSSEHTGRAALAWIGGNVAGFALLAAFYMSQGGPLRVSKKELQGAWQVMGGIAHLAVPAFLVRFQLYAPVLLVALLGGQAAAGQFRLAHLIVTMAVSMGVFLTNATFTQVASTYPSDANAAMQKLNEGIRTVNRFMVPVMVLGLVAGSKLVRLWLPSYDDAARFTPLLFAGVLLFTHAFYLRQMLPGIGLMRASTRAYLLPLCVLVGMFILVGKGVGASPLTAVVTALFLSEAGSYVYSRQLIEKEVGRVYTFGSRAHWSRR